METKKLRNCLKYWIASDLWWFPWVGWQEYFCTASASFLLFNNFSNSPTLLFVCYLHCGNYSALFCYPMHYLTITFGFWPLQRVVMSRSLVWGEDVLLLYFDVNCHINSLRFNPFYVFNFLSVINMKFNLTNGTYITELHKELYLYRIY